MRIMLIMLRKSFAGLVLTFFLATVGAAFADNNDLAQRGESAMNNGQFGEAIKVFEKITPTYENRQAVDVSLAWCYFVTETYDKAIPLYENLSGIRGPGGEIGQQSLYLLADCLARFAGTMPPDRPEREKNIKRAIELLTDFQSKYPKNAYIPNAIYSRAYAYYLLGELEKSEADLKTVVKAFPANPSARSAQYLLANVYSRQAMKSQKDGKAEDARKFMDKARDIFNELSKSEDNLAMSNNSIYSLAETWYDAEMFKGAMPYFRQVRTKADVLGDLKGRIEKLDRQRAAEFGQQGKVSAATKSELDKVRGQYANIKDSPDLMISAYLRIAVCYAKLHRYDEARIVCRHLLTAGTGLTGLDKQQASFLIVSTFLEEKDVVNAAGAFDDFQTNCGTDLPVAETTSLALGQLFMMRSDYSNAVVQFTKSVNEYPKGKGIEEALYMKFSAEFISNLATDATQTVDAYLTQFPKGKYTPNALYIKALSLASQGDWDKALATIDDVIQRFPKKTETFEAVDEVAYQKGYLLQQKAASFDPTKTGDPKEKERLSGEKKKALLESAKQYEIVLEQFKESKLRPVVMYQLGVVLKDAGEIDKAKTAFLNLAREYPTSELAPAGLYQQGIMYYERENYPEMEKVLLQMADTYPTNPINTDAYFFLGFVANKEARYDDAVNYLQRSIDAMPGNPRTVDSLLTIAQALGEKAKNMGQPTTLPTDRKTIYRNTLLESSEIFEDILVNFPDSDQAQAAIPGIAENIFELVRYQIVSEDDAAKHFQKAMERKPGDNTLKAQLDFSMGRYLLKNSQKDKALAAFNAALTAAPDAKLSPEMLTDYADALKDANDFAKAEGIYTKIINDYPNNPYALAPARFGLADIKFQQNDFKSAEILYKQVLKEYGWYEPGKQGKVKLAMIFEKNHDFSAAIKAYTEVTQQEIGEARISAMLGVARCQLSLAESKGPDWQNTIHAASENLTKIIVLYEAFPQYVTEAYWLQGKACEMVADLNKAKEMYYRASTAYPNQPYGKKCAERLQQMGGYTPPAPGAATAPAKK